MFNLNELKGNKVVLSGDVLLDPFYLTKIACLLKAFNVTGLVNKVDYLGLQITHGGFAPDDDGVAGIDADELYQDDSIEENKLKLESEINSNTIIASEKGNLALLDALLEYGVFELYRFDNNYLDGVCFLNSGDPDNVLKKNDKSTFYGDKSLVSDVLRGTNESQLWDNLLLNLPKPNKLDYEDFLLRQIHTRIAAVGRCARTKEPLITYSSWTEKWLVEAGLTNHSGVPLKEVCPILNNTITNQASLLPVGPFIESINGIAMQALIREAFEESIETNKKLSYNRREDFLILLMNLITSPVPILSQITNVCSYLYQRKRI